MSQSDAKKQLLRQIAELRGSINPEVLRRLELAKEGKVPYDRDQAQEAVRRFLAVKQDGGRFRARLLEALKKQQ